MEPNYGSMKKAELQEEARSRGLATSGTSVDLIARLQDDDFTTGGGELDTSDSGNPGAGVDGDDRLTDRSVNVPGQADERGTDGHVSETDRLLMDNPTVRSRQREETGRAPLPTTVNQLDGKEYTAVKQGGDTPVDGRFHKVFVVQARRDWETQLHEDGDMHRANFVGTLQEALNKGLHPRGEATFDGAEDTSDGSVRLKYSVEVIPAVEDEASSEAYVPRKAIVDMGGSTIEHAQVDVEQARLAEARTQNDPNERDQDGPALSSTTEVKTP